MTADHIARGLQDFTNKFDLLRLNSYQRDPSEVNDLKCDVKFGASSDVIKYRVVVCTCVTAAVIDSKYDFVFIDEAGHALEPEALIPVTSLLKE